MSDRLILSLENWSSEGRCLSGELDSCIFGVENEDVKACGNLLYDLDAQLFDHELLLTGTISAVFRLQCARCLKEFDYELRADALSLSFDVADELQIDVTDALREELVIELPSYPKCEISGQECQINDENLHFGLDKEVEAGVESPTPGGRSVWDALDRLK